MAKYRKRPIVIDAWELTPESRNEVGMLIMEWHQDKFGFTDLNFYSEDQHIEFRTLEGIMRANPGDYIVKGIQGEFYPIKPDIFEATYEEVLRDEGVDEIPSSK